MGCTDLSVPGFQETHFKRNFSGGWIDRSRRAPEAKLSGEEKGAESEERGRAKNPATRGLFRQA